MVAATQWRYILEVPYQQIATETLDALIEEFVSRDGTDYGAIELTLEQKLEQVKYLLKQDKAVIWFDEATETISIFHREEMANISLY